MTQIGMTRDEALAMYARLGIKPIGGGSGEGESGGGSSGESGNKGESGGQGGQGGESGEKGDKGSGESSFKAPASQDEFDRMIADRLKRHEAKVKQDAEKEIRERVKQEADAEEAKKQGNFQKLYEDEQKKVADLTKRIEALEQERKTESLQSIRERVAKELNLPSELADRLKGDTEEEIKADAKLLAKTVKPNPPDTEGGKGNKGSRGKPAAPAFSFRPATAVVKFPERAQQQKE